MRFIIILLLVVTPLSYGADAIFCNGFESCPAGPKQWEVRDSDDPPKPVGEVVDFGGESVLVLLEIAGKPAVLTTGYKGFGNGRGTSPLYITDDCLGTPYVKHSSGSGWWRRDDFGYESPIYLINTALFTEPDSNDTVTPFLCSGPRIYWSEPEHDVYKWLTGYDEFNNPYNECVRVAMQYVSYLCPIKQLTEDLKVTYPPPFTLHIKQD